jgi:hypothetical protein
MPTTPVPSSLSDRQRSILELLLNHIAQIPGVAAIVIGGSHARSTVRSDSDIDVGLYYHAANPFPIDQLVSAAGTIATTQASRQPASTTGALGLMEARGYKLRPAK